MKQTAADLYNQLPAEIKDRLSREKPVFETMTAAEIYDLLNDIRKMYPDMCIWVPFVEFCRVQAKAVATGEDYRTFAWLRSRPTPAIAVAGLDMEHSITISINSEIVGYFCHHNTDATKSAMWSISREEWLHIPKGKQYTLGFGKRKKIITVDSLFEAYKNGDREMRLVHKFQAKSSDRQEQSKRNPTMQKRVEVAAHIQKLPDDAVEIIETLFGIAGTVNILEPNIQRWRNRMDELFTGQFKKGDQK